MRAEVKPHRLPMGEEARIGEPGSHGMNVRRN